MAAFDFGAPAALLQKIYDEEATTQSDKYAFEPQEENGDTLMHRTITVENWIEFLGNKRCVSETGSASTVG